MYSGYFSDLKGIVYFAFADKDDLAGDLYAFDVRKRTYKRLFDDGFVKYTGKLSPQGDEIAYFAALLDRTVAPPKFPHNEAIELYVRGIKEVDIAPQPLTSGSNNSKRLPVWSPDGKRIAFMAILPSAKGEDPLKLRYWGIYLYEDGNVRVLTRGSYPQWSPDGTKLVFLREDGLYVYSLETERAEKVHSLPPPVRLTSKMSLSLDGSKLALSRPLRNNPGGILMIYNIASWDPFQVEVLKRFDFSDKQVYWPVFSPDNRYLLTQEINISANPDPRIMIYELETYTSRKFSDFSKYNFQVSYVTDWR